MISVHRDIPKGLRAVVLVDRFWLSGRLPWWYTIYQVQAVQHLKEEDLQHRIMTLQILALRKRRTSREDMPNGFRRLAAQSAHDLNLRPRSCLLAEINSCREQLLVKLVHASKDIYRTCPPLAKPAKATVSLFCILPSRYNQLPLPILARYLFL